MPAGPFQPFAHLHPVAPPVATDTRENVLLAAGEVFAHRGFKDATIREICERADANIAAVSYHFGDKAGLYAAVLEYAYAIASQRAPIEAFFAHANTPEQKLRAMVEMMFTRIVDQGRPSWHGVLMAREMVEPTSALDHVVTQSIAPMWKRMTDIVHAFLGPHASEAEITAAGNSIVGQILHYKHARPIIVRMQHGQAYSSEQIDYWARHVADFSVAGLHALRAAIDQRSTPTHDSGAFS
jgi:AcrR family transcriptional regulator